MSHKNHVIDVVAEDTDDALERVSKHPAYWPTYQAVLVDLQRRQTLPRDEGWYKEWSTVELAELARARACAVVQTWPGYDAWAKRRAVLDRA
jgi:hypothetical protein